VATILAVDPPNSVGNVRCVVETGDGLLGWIMYYPGGTRSNINLFPTAQAAALRATLGPGQSTVSGEEAE